MLRMRVPAAAATSPKASGWTSRNCSNPASDSGGGHENLDDIGAMETARQFIAGLKG